MMLLAVVVLLLLMADHSVGLDVLSAAVIRNGSVYLLDRDSVSPNSTQRNWTVYNLYVLQSSGDETDRYRLQLPTEGSAGRPPAVRTLVESPWTRNCTAGLCEPVLLVTDRAEFVIFFPHLLGFGITNASFRIPDLEGNIFPDTAVLSPNGTDVCVIADVKNKEGEANRCLIRVVLTTRSWQELHCSSDLFVGPSTVTANGTHVFWMTLIANRKRIHAQNLLHASPVVVAEGNTLTAVAFSTYSNCTVVLSGRNLVGFSDSTSSLLAIPANSLPLVRIIGSGGGRSLLAARTPGGSIVISDPLRCSTPFSTTLSNVDVLLTIERMMEVEAHLANVSRTIAVDVQFRTNNDDIAHLPTGVTADAGSNTVGILVGVIVLLAAIVLGGVAAFCIRQRKRHWAITGNKGRKGTYYEAGEVNVDDNKPVVPPAAVSNRRSSVAEPPPEDVRGRRGSSSANKRSRKDSKNPQLAMSPSFSLLPQFTPKNTEDDTDADGNGGDFYHESSAVGFSFTASSGSPNSAMRPRGKSAIGNSFADASISSNPGSANNRTSNLPTADSTTLLEDTTAALGASSGKRPPALEMESSRNSNKGGPGGPMNQSTSGLSSTEEQNSSPCHTGDALVNNSSLTAPTPLNAAKRLQRDPSAIKFKKGHMVGSGANGRVYVGIDENSGQLLAAKEISLGADDAKNEEKMQLMKQEIAVMKELSKLSHENIVEYIGAYRAGNDFYIFMEYVPGGSLRSTIDGYGKTGLAISLIKTYTRQLVAGLSYLHSFGLVHRDIKAANVLVGVDGVAKLADFGASRHVETITGQTGTQNWMAPEVIRMEKLTLAGDIWALGCTVMEMATGKVPFAHIGNQFQVLQYVANGTEPVELPPSIEDPDLRDFLESCLQKDHTKRPTADELLTHRFLREATPRRPTTDHGEQPTPLIDSGEDILKQAVLHGDIRLGPGVAGSDFGEKTGRDLRLAILDAVSSKVKEEGQGSEPMYFPGRKPATSPVKQGLFPDAGRSVPSMSALEAPTTVQVPTQVDEESLTPVREVHREPNHSPRRISLNSEDAPREDLTGHRRDRPEILLESFLGDTKLNVSSDLPPSTPPLNQLNVRAQHGRSLSDTGGWQPDVSNRTHTYMSGGGGREESWYASTLARTSTDADDSLANTLRAGDIGEAARRAASERTRTGTHTSSFDVEGSSSPLGLPLGPTERTRTGHTTDDGPEGEAEHSDHSNNSA